MAERGTLFGVGLGPGDPELMTLKAVAAVERARVVAFFAKRGGLGNAHAIARRHILPEAEQLPLIYPYTTEIAAHHPDYLTALRGFYDQAAATVATRLERGQDVCVLCEGDPLLYGSYIYLHDRLARAYRTTIVPGITSFSGSAARAGVPLVSAQQTFSIIPGTLAEPELESKLRQGHAVAIIKLGSNFGKVRRVIERLGKLSQALYFEHATTEREMASSLVERSGERSPYFSLILVPAHDGERMGPLAVEAGAGACKGADDAEDVR